MKFEECLWELCAAEIKHFHSDNEIFTADMFREDQKQNNQKQSFSGVCAYNQNCQSEHVIKNIMYWEHTFMVHNALHWDKNGADNDDKSKS